MQPKELSEQEIQWIFQDQIDNCTEGFQITVTDQEDDEELATYNEIFDNFHKRYEAIRGHNGLSAQEKVRQLQVLVKNFEEYCTLLDII